MQAKFFKKNHTSGTIYAGGPPYPEQLRSLAENTYWKVLNTSFLGNDKKEKPLYHNDDSLSLRVNAMKHTLQTYGPMFAGVINNEGEAKGSIFHGHVNNSNGTTYVLEWAIIDPIERVMALTNFAKHENFPYIQAPLTKQDIVAITADPKNINIMARMELKAQEAADKVERTEANYRNI